MADRLASLLDHFSVTAQLFHAGVLCGSHLLAEQANQGQLHLIRRGPLTVHHGNDTLVIDRPSLLLYPRPLAHRFESDPQTGAEMACANLVFEGGTENSICNALPDVVCLALDEMPDAAAVLALLFDEAFSARCGRATVVNRLFEVVLVQVLRELMERSEVKGGMLAGLAHPRLRHALVAMHADPAKGWGLEELGQCCGMSRSVFASSFKEVVGSTPGAYLQQWRISLAQRMLRQGKALQQIAQEIGYGSETAFSRAFRAQVGMPPRQWREAARRGSSGVAAGGGNGVLSLS